MISMLFAPTDATLREVKEMTVSLAESVGKLAESVSIRNTLQPILTYGSSQITTCHDPGFRADVLRAYGYSGNAISGRSKTIHCIILGHPVPSSSLIAGHLFKFQWARVSDRLLGVDINDPRNGLPMFKPLEDAFDTLRLIIICT